MQMGTSVNSRAKSGRSVKKRARGAALVAVASAIGGMMIAAAWAQRPAVN